MSNVLTAADLRNLFSLVVTADVKIGQVPNLWVSVQRLEIASKSGHDYIPADALPAQNAA